MRLILAMRVLANLTHRLVLARLATSDLRRGQRLLRRATDRMEASGCFGLPMAGAVPVVARGRWRR